MILVEKLLPKARDRLVTIGSDAALTEAAGSLFDSKCRMVVVCDSEGSMIGVVTATDIVRQIRQCQGSACTTGCALVMSKEVISCRPEDSLNDTWELMKNKELKSIPVVDSEYKPIGLVSARDALEVLLSEAEHEEDLLKDYVMGVGYR